MARVQDTGPKWTVDLDRVYTAVSGALKEYRGAGAREACSRPWHQPVASTFKRVMSALKVSWSIGEELYCQNV